MSPVEARGSARYHTDAVIVGAGFSGINMACRLRARLGISNFVVYDRAAELGGAWAANKYPGCGVDIPGALYSLSWMPNLESATTFPSQPEILRYAQRIATACDLHDKIRLQVEWTGARWQEDTDTWRVYLRDLVTDQHYTHDAKIFISAVGGYTNPRWPAIPGLDSFRGRVLHTAEWDPQAVITDRRVVVVGNGCSASQVVPAILGEASSVIQFMRSPQHFVAASNDRLPDVVRRLFAWFPLCLVLVRWSVFWFLEMSHWQFHDGPIGRALRQRETRRSQLHVRRTVDEQYWPLVLPRYELGCRRRILDNGYLSCLQNPKFQLRQDTIVSVSADQILTAAGVQYPADMIILATGFEFSQWRATSLIGRGGLSLQDHWKTFGGAEAYRSVAMHGFPNFFYLLGPNAGSGHTSVLYSIECCVDLVIGVAKPVFQARALREWRLNWRQKSDGVGTSRTLCVKLC